MKEDQTTETKIKEAARSIFLRKGYEATRTRDIAEASGINLALLNYYFRSKKKLFDQIMNESLHTFLGVIFTILNDPDSSIREKISAFVDTYINMLQANPNLPIFILSEIRTNPEEFVKKMEIKEKLMGSIFKQQFFEEVRCGTIHLQINPIHILFNLSSLIVFPFIASPLVKEMANLDDESFQELMQERRTLIPGWIEALFDQH